MPSPLINSATVYTIVVTFYVGEHPTVLISSKSAVPYHVMSRVLERSERAFLQSKGRGTEYDDLARWMRWLPALALRDRISQVEASVRSALSDERFTDADFASLRDYPARLAQVERLAGELPVPELRSLRPQSELTRLTKPLAPDALPQALRDIAQEARDAVARLSGLISSQQVVLTQRQAAQAAQFQRLITLVGTAVLVPGLVAAIFGANVGFRGRDGVPAFWAMLSFMLAGGIGSYAILRTFEADGFARLAERLDEAVPERSRLLLLLAAALLFAAVGLYLLSGGF